MLHDGCDMLNQSSKGIIVLTKNEQYRIKTGRVLDFHFHGPQFPNSTIFFFVSDENHIVTENSKIGKEFIKQGSICPVVITREMVKAMEEEKSPGYTRTLDTEPPFVVTITTSDMYKKIIRDRREKFESWTSMYKIKDYSTINSETLELWFTNYKIRRMQRS